MSTAKKTFEEILAKFKARLSTKELEDFTDVTLLDVKKTILRIQNDQENLKRTVNMARLRGFLEAMDQFGKTVDVFLNASCFVAFVWGPMKFMLMAASNFIEDFEILLEAYEDIGEQIPLLQQYKALFTSDYMKEVLALIYTDIIQFHSKAIRLFSGKATVWQKVFRSMWRDFNTRFQGILDNLKRHKALIRDQAQLLHYQQSQQNSVVLHEYVQHSLQDSETLHKHIQQYMDDRAQRILAAEHKEELERQSKYVAVIQWLSASQGTRSDHERACQTRRESPVSGDWILQHEKVQNWRETDTPTSSMLWINGKPGAGKTILVSVIIEKCMEDPAFKTAYFYCNESDPLKSSSMGIFKGLLSQLLNQCQELIPYCYEKSTKSGEATTSSTSMMELLLKLFCEKIPKLFIIIDGLDECVPLERKAVMGFLKSLVEHCDGSAPGKLRVLFVSQFYNDIKKQLLPAPDISLTSDDNKNDIRDYVFAWSKKIEAKHELDAPLVKDIQEKTCIRADGMFLYAKLVMENLFAHEQRENLLHEIKEYFPRGLEDAYERLLSRIKGTLHPRVWNLIQRLLGWMVCVRRPLKWSEIQAAISIDPTQQAITFEAKKLRSHIQDLCGSLIIILPEGRGVELVHSTAKIYIARTEYIRITTVECELATLCIQYLVFGCFRKDLDNQTLRQYALSGQFAFQDYAFAKWFHHFQSVVDEGYVVLMEDVASRDSVEELEDAIENLVNEYDLVHDPIHAAAHEACTTFVSSPFHNDFLYIWSHLRQHELKGSSSRNDVSIAALGEALARNREVIEELASSGTDLTPFYGDKPYKCPKITCFYFHEGFKDVKTRKQHINRHDRPFICTAPSTNCTGEEFGFTSNKDLEKHMKLYHPELHDQANQFPKAMKPTAPKKLTCDHCDKTFTREFHKKNHMRTHFGDKPFSCEECGKSFTRANDCKRHEKIHAKQ